MFSCADDVVATFEQCLGSDDYSVIQTALQNLAEFTLLAQGKKPLAVLVRTFHPEMSQYYSSTLVCS